MKKSEFGNIMERSVTKKIPISELKLDPENVRLKHLKSGSMTEEEIEKYFWKEDATKELYAQILAARGVYQDLIVTANGIVKEGNRRLICLRKLKAEAHAAKLIGVSPTQFDEVKCTVLPPDTTEREIFMLLATIHVRGKKSWDAFNKSKMIAYLHNDIKVSYDDLSAELGVAKVTLIRMINSYIATVQYGDKYPDDSNWYSKFTYFDEFYKRRSLKPWRENPANLLQFFSWIKDRRITDHRQIRSLDKILENPVSRKIFDESGFEAAINFLNSIDPTIEDSDFRKISHTIKTLQLLDRKAIIRIIEDPARLKILQNLRHEINSLLLDIQAIQKVKEDNLEEIKKEE